ncbi:MAG TPA: bacterial proteasome activator family protein [Mycobacteriales bacterium]|nr:bacterial proteasome activator family protein [Mycobacteriales bacterium]
MSETTPPPQTGSEQPHPVVIVAPDGQGTVVADPSAGPASMISSPDKVMRIGTMVKQLLEEVKAAPLDDKARARLAEVHERSIKELADGLSPELRDELERLALPFTQDEVPSESELRIAQAQLVGWLEGVFHGIQAALVAQQVNARMQIEQMRGRPQLPPGFPGAPATDGNGAGGTGQYL